MRQTRFAERYVYVENVYAPLETPLSHVKTRKHGHLDAQ